MFIKSLKMVNFRQFKGTTNIQFYKNNGDSDKNVTIILGDNTFGKTTLLQAFNWCFYQKAEFRENPEDLLNYDVSNGLNNGDETSVEIEIILVHDKTEYVITRSRQYVCQNGTVRGLQPSVKVSYKQPDGQMEAIRAIQIKNVINNILPEDLSSFFFFDTERVGSISTRKDVTSAVKGLLGLSEMENAIKHLGQKSSRSSAIGKFYASMDIEGDAKAQDALARIQDEENRREAITTQMETCLSEIEHYEGRKEQLDNILRDNQSTAVLQKKKETLERNVATELVAQTRTIKVFLDEFNYGSAKYFAFPLIRRATDFLHEAKIDDKGIKDLTRTTILDIIKRGICICGTEIEEGNYAYKHLMDELNYVPPESIGNTVRHYKENLDVYNSDADRIFESLKARYEELYRSKMRVQDWNDEISEVSALITGKEDMKKYELELVDIKSRLRDLQAKKEKLIREDESHKQKINSLQKVYDSLIAVTGKNQEAMTNIKYAEEIREWLISSYTEREDLIRENLEERVNAIFERMYHGHRRVVIDKKYQVTLLSAVADREIATGESEGANRVKNFAFIAGLVALAKEQIISKFDEKGINLSTEPYPLTMDAPFSNADSTHTRNISSILPEVAEQVIMFVMEKDWRYAEPVLANKICRQYLLQKQSETYTVIKEV